MDETKQTLAEHGPEAAPAPEPPATDAAPTTSKKHAKKRDGVKKHNKFVESLRSIGKLVRGELFKYFKSKTLVIMSVLLAIAIGIMSLIYINYDKEVNFAIDFVFGNTSRVTAFDLFGEDSTVTDLVREAMGGEYGEDAAQLEQAFDLVKKNEPYKTLILQADPAVLEAMSKAYTPGSPLYGMMSEYSEAEQTAVLGQFVAYGVMAEMQKAVSEGLYKDYVAADAFNIVMLDEFTEYLRNPVTDENGETHDTFGRSTVGYILGLLETFEADFLELQSDYAALTAISDLGSDDYRAAYMATLGSFAQFANTLSRVEYFTNSSLLSTNYLLLKTSTFVNSKYRAFSTAMEPFDSIAYESVLEAYDEVVGGKEDRDRVAAFREEFLSLYDKSYEPTEPEQSEYELSPDFVSALATLLTNATKDSGIFSYYGKNRDAIDAAYEKPAEERSPVENNLLRSYLDEDGKLVPLNTAVSMVKSSYDAVVTESMYDKQIRPYYELEREHIEESRAALTEAQTRYTDAELILGVMDDKLGKGDFAETIDFGALYNDLHNNFVTYGARTATVNDLIVKVNLYETIEANGLNDEEAKSIQGFIMNSRYALRSSITKSQYIIEHGALSTDYVTPESVGGGYGAMQFIFILTSVIILVFGIVLAAGAIAGEHSDGTMKLLLIRPHRRWHVLLAKFLAVVILILGFYILNYALTALIGIAWGYGSPTMALSIVNSTKAVVMHPAVVLLLYHVFGAFEAIVFAEIAMTLSTVVKSRAGAVSVSMLVYFLSFILTALLSNFGWYKFIIFNNTNLTSYIASTGPALADLTLGFSLIVDLVYIVALAVLAFWTFAKRDAT